MGVAMQSTEMLVGDNNNNVDTDTLLEFKRLNEEYQRLAEPIKGKTKRGADYHISHPFEREHISEGIVYLGANQKI